MSAVLSAGYDVNIAACFSPHTGTDESSGRLCQKPNASSYVYTANRQWEKKASFSGLQLSGLYFTPASERATELPCATRRPLKRCETAASPNTKKAKLVHASDAK